MTDIELARQTYRTGRFTFVLARGGQVLATGTEDGIGELLDVVETHRQAVSGAALADKIVGKAVAMVAVYAGISEVYTPLGSEAAAQTLREHHVRFDADRLVPLIRNQRGDGPCPMEQLTLPLDDAAAAVTALHTFVAQRRQAAHAPR